MKKRYWDDRKYIYNSIFTYKTNRLSENISRYSLYGWRIFSLILHLVIRKSLEKTSEILETISNKFFIPLRVIGLTILSISLIMVIFSVITSFFLLGIMVGIGIVKYLSIELLILLILSKRLVFLLIFCSIIFWGLSIVLNDFLKESANKLSSRGLSLHIKEGYSFLGNFYGIASTILEKCHDNWTGVFKIFTCGLLAIILARLLGFFP